MSILSRDSLCAMRAERRSGWLLSAKSRKVLMFQWLSSPCRPSLGECCCFILFDFDFQLFLFDHLRRYPLPVSQWNTIFELTFRNYLPTQKVSFMDVRPCALQYEVHCMTPSHEKILQCGPVPLHHSCQQCHYRHGPEPTWILPPANHIIVPMIDIAPSQPTCPVSATSKSSYMAYFRHGYKHAWPCGWKKYRYGGR